MCFISKLDAHTISNISMVSTVVGVVGKVMAVP